MNGLQRTQPTTIQPVPHTDGPQQPVTVYQVQQHWLAAFEGLHPATQVTVAIVAGLGLTWGVVALGTLVSGLATFALSVMAVLSQLALTIGAGIGILVLVVVGVIAVLKV